MKKMVHTKIITVFLLLSILVGFFSCTKDELAEPATITCEFLLQSDNVMEGKLTMDRLDLNLSKLDISGRRVNENDMFFTRKFNRETGHFKLLDAEVPSTVLQIPQGSYETLVFYVTVTEEEYEFEYGSSGDDDETGDLAEYIQKAKPGILVVGRYNNGTEDFPVIISLNDDIRKLALDASQNGLPSVVLQKEIPSRAVVTFDVSFWFTAITPAMMEAALTFPLNGENSVVISEDYNENIYNQIASRIQGSTTLVIEDQ